MENLENLTNLTILSIQVSVITVTYVLYKTVFQHHRRGGVQDRDGARGTTRAFSDPVGMGPRNGGWAGQSLSELGDGGGGGGEAPQINVLEHVSDPVSASRDKLHPCEQIDRHE